jgi:hypothetical protein
LLLVTTTQIQGQDEEVVTMEYFGKVLAWFGNLKEGANILEKIKAVVANTYVFSSVIDCTRKGTTGQRGGTDFYSSWFHGDISMSESEARLANKLEGTYLIRFSTSEIGTYTISKVSESYSAARPPALQ